MNATHLMYALPKRLEAMASWEQNGGKMYF